MREHLLDDFLHNEEEEALYQNPTVAERIVAILIDYFVVVLITIPFAIVATIMGGETPLIAAVMLTLFLLKDLFGGQSFAKTIKGMKVVDVKAYAKPKAFPLVFRNVFFIVWIFDLIPLLYNPSRRLGDMLVGLQVVKTRAPSPSWKAWFGQLKGYALGDLLLSLFFALVYGILIFKFLSILEELASAAGV